MVVWLLVVVVWGYDWGIDLVFFWMLVVVLMIGIIIVVIMLVVWFGFDVGYLVVFIYCDSLFVFVLFGVCVVIFIGLLLLV